MTPLNGISCLMGVIGILRKISRHSIEYTVTKDRQRLVVCIQHVYTIGLRSVTNGKEGKFFHS